MKVSTKKYKRGSVSICNYICEIYCFIWWMKINTKSFVFSDPVVFSWWYAIDLAFQLWNLYIMVSFLMRKIFHKNLILKRELTWKFWGKATWIISSAMKTKQLFRDAERELLLILEIPLQWWSWSSVNLCFPKFYQLFFRKPRIAAFSVCDTYFFCNDASLRQSIFALLFLKTNPLENCALRKLSLLLSHPRLLLRLVRRSGNFFVKNVTSP